MENHLHQNILKRGHSHDIIALDKPGNGNMENSPINRCS